MQKLVVLIVAFAAFTLFVGEASAVETTPAKVGEACGANIQAGCIELTCAYGCDKKCEGGAEGICTYNCCSGPNCGETGCHVHDVRRTFFGKKIKLPLAAYVRMHGRTHRYR